MSKVRAFGVALAVAGIVSAGSGIAAAVPVEQGQSAPSASTVQDPIGLLSSGSGTTVLGLILKMITSGSGTGS
ncbi:hypothetical protein OG203_07415 [Nocardia sp. NBC_01499]|uniref:hypothetical protein n=1 Tax=Nocardia sp. NBC_01499 TaxID=2903597 RepID=UPI0038677451